MNHFVASPPPPHTHRVIPVSSEDQDLPTIPPSPPPPSHQPPVKRPSKISSIKKSLNQKIKLNSHVKFDDEGDEVPGGSSSSSARKRGRKHPQVEDVELNSEEESDSGPDDSIAPVPIEEYESRRKSGHEVKVGGIEIAKAQQRIEARDKADRRKERERVQREHKQRRLKRRGSREGGDGDQGVALLADESPPGEESGGEEGREKAWPVMVRSGNEWTVVLWAWPRRGKGRRERRRSSYKTMKNWLSTS